MRLILASRNDHKLRELSQLMPFELDPLPDGIELPPETGTTFADNALGKARAAAGATGRPAIADDSGIEAAALRGAPGVWSARFAGEQATDEENLAKLLREVPAGGDRRVAYVCALAYVEPGGREELVHGRCEGALAREPRGRGGFGYDPAFVPDDYPGDERTMAELSAEEKDAISHRGRAARALAARLLEIEEESRPQGPLRALLGGSGRRRKGRR
ncbi:MAG TPA: RdgB/HAM1 family non-canonical purine NTP pyrophosphatase [Thermoleophilaceae bacterium]|nr:RdgB/HAM1 family non-canonical purine NTP pyrophosphatase [Thermoleophilaceae bacterium]